MTPSPTAVHLEQCQSDSGSLEHGHEELVRAATDLAIARVTQQAMLKAAAQAALQHLRTVARQVLQPQERRPRLSPLVPTLRKPAAAVAQTQDVLKTPLPVLAATGGASVKARPPESPGSDVEIVGDRELMHMLLTEVLQCLVEEEEGLRGATTWLTETLSAGAAAAGLQADGSSCFGSSLSRWWEAQA